MDIVAGIKIPTVFYYANITDEEGNTIENLDEPFINTRFYSLDNIAPANYNGCTNGTVITSSGLEYFTYIDCKAIEDKIQQLKNREIKTMFFYKN